MLTQHTDKFYLSIITKNTFYYAQTDLPVDYQLPSPHQNNIKPLTQPSPKDEQSDIQNLQDLWNNIELEEREMSTSNKILLVPMEIHQEMYEPAKDQPNGQKEQQADVKMIEKGHIKQQQQRIKFNMIQSGNHSKEFLLIDLQNEEAENLQQLWNEIQSQNSSDDQNVIEKDLTAPHIPPNQSLPQQLPNIIEQSPPLKTEQPSDVSLLPVTPAKSKLALLQEKNLNSMQFSKNVNLSKDFLIYDYQTYMLHFYSANIFSYFGFYQCPIKKHHYYLYDLATEENIIECFLDQLRDIDFSNNQPKTPYQNSNQCLRYKIIKTNQLLGTAYFKPISNGLIYKLKPFNFYQQKHQDSIALIQITDGYIANNCYCNTSVFISQKYAHKSSQLKMIIGFKNGYLIANMGVNGVKSAPYNCRLENNNGFSFLLGLMDKEPSDFVIRIGEGMCVFVGMGVGVGRKRYIDSFHE